MGYQCQANFAIVSCYNILIPYESNYVRDEITTLHQKEANKRPYRIDCTDYVDTSLSPALPSVQYFYIQFFQQKLCKAYIEISKEK